MRQRKSLMQRHCNDKTLMVPIVAASNPSSPPSIWTPSTYHCKAA